MVSQTGGVSSALLAAQERLVEVRRQQQAMREVCGLTNAEYSDGRFPSPTSPSLQAIQSGLAHLPTHLGWGSANLTAVLRPSQQPIAICSASPAPLSIVQPIENQPERPSPTAVITLYPDLGLAMLRENQTAAGRIWLLLRQLDEAGRGWVDETTTRRILTERRSEQRVCGWRQMRNLLRQGQGVFWQWQNGRIWLASVAKAAAALGLARLVQRPVAIPLAVLTGSISLVRAHFYASFHSSRKNQTGDHKPIARATLHDVSATTPKTQRVYERKSRVKTQTHFAVGPACSPEQRQEVGWRKGPASFEFVDHNGRQGKPGATYVAWQLPNSYHGPHQTVARGRQKRINRELTDLFTQGMTGNGQPRIDPPNCLARRYFRNGRLAAKHLHQSTTTADSYWPDRQANRGAAGQIWHVLPGHTAPSPTHHAL